MCSKVHTLKKCAYLFDLNLKVIHFKLFIQSSYDYCSTLFFHFSDKTDSDRLDKSFIKAVNKFLNIKLYEIMLDIRSQIDVLDKYHMQPLQLRFFYHFLSFTYSAFNNCAG